MIPIKDDIPTRTYPYVTIALMVVNVMVFFYQATLGPRGAEIFVYRAAAIPFEITHLQDIYPANIVPPPFTLITAMFLHGGVVHIGGNMLFLWIFGDNIEDVLGHVKFLVFYLITGVVASMAHILVDVDSTVPMLGASGAVAGILGAYFLLFPRANVLTLVFLIFLITFVRIPAVVFLGLWFVFQILRSGSADGVAWLAHIGGFVAGAVGILLFAPREYRRRIMKRR